jgi:hypothetical protein
VSRLAGRLFGLLAVVLLVANPVLANVCAATCAEGEMIAPAAQGASAQDAPASESADIGGCPEHAAHHVAPAPETHAGGAAVHGVPHADCCGGHSVSASSEAASRADVTPAIATITVADHALNAADVTLSWRRADAASPPPLFSPHSLTILRI